MFRQSTFPNLMDTHPPGLFQIDGNLGAANGMLEVLVQSHWMPDATEIQLLPALPEQWSAGSAHGIHVRGGGVIDMQWKDKEITSLELRVTNDTQFKMIPPVGQTISRIQTSRGLTIHAETTGVIAVKDNNSYTIIFR